MSAFVVRYSANARADLLRLHEHRLLAAKDADDLRRADEAVDVIEATVRTRLATNPFLCRKIGPSQRRRELVIPFGRTGYVALFEVLPATARTGNEVLILALRHQLEHDYF